MREKMAEASSPQTISHHGSECGSVNSKNSSLQSTSPLTVCTICIEPIARESKCFAYSCLHQFCFECLKKWSKIKTECPLCKQKFDKIIHSVVSPRTYKEYFPASPIRPFALHLSPVHFNSPPILTTLINIPLLQEQIQLNQVQALFGYDSPTVRQYARNHADDFIPSRTAESGLSWRAYCYRNSLYARNHLDEPHIDLMDSRNYYLEHPVLLQILYEWLARETKALLRVLRERTNRQEYSNATIETATFDSIKNALTNYNILSFEFDEAIPLLYPFTPQFVHELQSFAGSMHNYSIAVYDSNVMYDVFLSPEEYVNSLNDNEVIDLSSSQSSITLRRSANSEDIFTSESDSTSNIFNVSFGSPSQQRFAELLLVTSTPIRAVGSLLSNNTNDSDALFQLNSSPFHNLGFNRILEMNSTITAFNITNHSDLTLQSNSTPSNGSDLEESSELNSTPISFNTSDSNEEPTSGSRKDLSPF